MYSHQMWYEYVATASLQAVRDEMNSYMIANPPSPILVCH